MVWIEGMRELNERAHRQTSNALDLCESALDWNVEADTVNLVIEVCREIEQYIAARTCGHVASSLEWWRGQSAPRYRRAKRCAGE